jgi:hypothetical protein
MKLYEIYPKTYKIFESYKFHIYSTVEGVHNRITISGKGF